MFANAEASILASVSQQFLSASDKISISVGPRTDAIIDYAYHNGRVFNRRFHVVTQLKVNIPTGDATVSIWMNIELWFDRSSKKIMSTLHSFDVNTSVPTLTADLAVSAEDLGARFKGPLEARRDVDVPLPDKQQFPAGAPVLSLKVMPDHSVRVYVP
jgi:hypothetical protein